MKTPTTIAILLICLIPPAAAAEPRSISTENWLPLENHATPYRITEGKDEGERIIQTLTHNDDTPNGWWITLGQRRRTHLQPNEDGGLSITEQIFPTEETHCRFHPPVTMLPPSITPGQPIEQQGAVRLYDTRTGEEKSAGAYTHTLELINEHATVQTPAGEFTGHHLRAIQTMDLDGANVRITMNILFHPGRGRVYQYTTKHIEKLGILEDNSIEELRLDTE